MNPTDFIPGPFEPPFSEREAEFHRKAKAKAFKRAGRRSATAKLASVGAFPQGPLGVPVVRIFPPTADEGGFHYVDGPAWWGRD